MKLKKTIAIAQVAILALVTVALTGLSLRCFGSRNPIGGMMMGALVMTVYNFMLAPAARELKKLSRRP